MRSALPDAALILAGGLGTRLRPITNKIPKPLVRIGKKPTIAHIIDEIYRNGISDIYVSVGYKAWLIERYLRGYGSAARIRLIKEKTLLGTGGAIKLALGKIKADELFVANGDDLFRMDIGEMYAFHKSHKSRVTMCIKKARSNKELSSSGVVKLNGFKVVGFAEKPKPEDAPSRFINIGKYIISADVVKYFPKERRFSFERDFLEKAVGKISVCAYKSKGVWYPTDTFERLSVARRKWHPQPTA